MIYSSKPKKLKCRRAVCRGGSIDNISFEKLFLKQLEPPNFDWKPEDSDQTQLGGCCQFNGFDFDPEEGNIEDEFQDF